MEDGYPESLLNRLDNLYEQIIKQQQNGMTGDDFFENVCEDIKQGYNIF
ncbi:MAG: hypothetical protein H6766_02805 [Candidatus Peribacteria bacterium]|nr:MAG: hypothetical protein H6766_02805 [Candidatus Peribacteria bacterium]